MNDLPKSALVLDSTTRNYVTKRHKRKPLEVDPQGRIYNI
jgi:hypothetical protein